METALATLLHLVVFAYWLGGDVGAFRASFVLTDATATPAARLTAGRLLNAIDMAPRTALVLTVPTGLLSAQAGGWLDLPALAHAAVWTAAGAWAALVWRLHLRHDPPGSVWRRLDLGLRWAVLASVGAGLAMAGTTGTLPVFLQIKLGLFAGALALGLVIRAMLAPLVARTPDAVPGPASDAALSVLMGQVRLMVIGIWALLLAAALLGVWKPL